MTQQIFTEFILYILHMQSCSARGKNRKKFLCEPIISLVHVTRTTVPVSMKLC